MKKQMFAALLICAMVLSMLSGTAMAAKKEKKPEPMPPTGNLDIADALTQELTVTVDGVETKVAEYIDVYIPEPSITDQKLSIFIPEGATKDSPIVLCVNNSGWMANSWAARTKVADDDPEKLAEYTSIDDKDKIGAILSRNFVLVSYGGRSRNGDPIDGKYDGHSPGIVADTKAVIRYLRSNAEALPAGDVEKIIITGTSGGGALSTVIAASGDSLDYFESLYEIGAAGVEKNEDGSYSSSISDSVFAVIAYCPITDLGNADAAYEWTYRDARAALADIDFNDDPEKDPQIYYSADAATVMPEVSDVLAANYAAYVDGLGLKLDDGSDLTSANLKDAIVGLMEAEIAESIEEIGVKEMRADIQAQDYNELPGVALDWLTINDDGSFSYDIDKHLTWVAANKQLKTVCAFSNRGLSWGNMNEDTLFGTPDFQYSAFEPYSWDNDAEVGNGCGKDDTGMSWDEFMQTEDGARLAKQIRMTNAVEYLNDKSGSAEAGKKAAHWYVRYGMNDRDSSFALETILRYSIANCADITDANFEFAWLMPHSGDYDVTEAYAWLDAALAQ